MRVIRSVRSMQRLALRWRREGRRVGFVPTMGYLHAGHLSLVRRARRAVGSTGVVVVSLYVNPTQFGPREDLSRYPRDFRQDRKLCQETGVDVIFRPTDQEIYPGQASGDYSTYVIEETLSLLMEGASRPAHFRGVTTIVAKLCNIILPDVAVFGAKDFQQAALIQRMVKDLNFPVRLIVAPTVREPDGLAMSSRNKFLTGSLRRQALVLWQSIQWVKKRLRRTSKPCLARPLKQALKSFIEEQPDARLDYVEFFNPRNLEAVSRVQRGTHLALAVYLGNTRLIDNARL